MQSAAHDFNGDHKSDILWRNGTNVAIWFLTNAGVPTFGNVGTVPLDWKVVGTSANGHILWQQDVSGAITIWDMNGVAVSQSHNLGSVPQTSGWAIVGAGDFDGNGHGDLLWRNADNGAVTIWFLANGAVTGSGNVGTVVDPWFIDLTGDFDGDGKSDIVWTHSSGPRVLWRMDGANVLQSSNIANVPIIWDIQWMAAE